MSKKKSYSYAYPLPVLVIRLLRIGKPIAFYLVVSAFASLVGNLARLGVMGFGVAAILNVSQMLAGDWRAYLAGVIFSGSLIALCRYLEGRYSHVGAYNLLAQLRVHLFEEIDRLAPTILIERSQGELLSIAVTDVETLEFFFAHTIGPLFTVVLVPLAALMVAARVHLLYVAVLLPIFVLTSVLIPLLALRVGRGIGLRYRAALAQLKSLVLESVYGIQDIQIFSAGQQRKRQVLAANEQVNSSAHGLALHQQAVSALPDFFVYLARILVVVVAAHLAAAGVGSPAGAIIVSFVATASFSSTFSLTFVVTHLLEAFAAADRIFRIEDCAAAIADTGHGDCGSIQSIEFENVSFSYPGAHASVLDGANLHINAGERIGIAGPSGAGKSTSFRLLLRFYDPNRGHIRINGVDAREISLNVLRQRIALLEQDTYLFDCSVADNIAFAQPTATFEEVRRAAKRAGIADLIESLPEAYDTQMGQMGARLSGGERQRIGIARVLLADPDVIVMDEPTSALDVLHERELLHTLQTAYADKTIIMVSHRPSTLSSCDRVYQLEDRKFIKQISDKTGVPRAL